MTETLIDWNKDLPADPKEEYEALVRSLSWIDGFGLIFVRCSPAEGERLIEKVSEDIPQKNIEVLALEKPIGNLYDIVDNLPDKEQINILFVTGIEKSFVEYIKPGYGGQGDYYKLDTVPRVLGHLNLQRERFRDNFNICFVFILPLFGLKYFIRRAPDFFDWRSGVFEFPTEREIVESESMRIIFEGDFEKYLSLTPLERNQKILEIQEWLTEDNQTPNYRFDLLVEVGDLLLAGKEYATAIASYDRALEIKPDKYEAWNNRGIALFNLGRYEEALASYDRTLAIKPDLDAAWNNRGIALFNLGRYEEALASYDRALAIKPDTAFSAVMRYIQKLANLFLTVAISIFGVHHYYWNVGFGKDEAWYYRGNALRKLGRYEEALASYDRALEIKPNNDEAWYYRGNALHKLGRYEEAITSYDRALEIKPNNDEAWYYRGDALYNLGRYEETIASFDRALAIKPDDDLAWYNKACCYALQGDVNRSMENLQKAIELNPEYREDAKTDSDFDRIRENKRFQEIIQNQ